MLRYDYKLAIYGFCLRLLIGSKKRSDCDRDEVLPDFLTVHVCVIPVVMPHV